jgi:DNA-nicking Smr family endonuclease
MFSHMTDREEFAEPEAVEMPIDGTLDLHTFHPRDVKTLLPDYFQACQERGLYQVRVVHGKGTGALRRSVHALLDRLEEVDSYRLGGMGEGSWGATLVELRRPESC